MAIQRFDLEGKSSVADSPYGMFVTYADHAVECDRRHQQATDYYRQTMDKCLTDGIAALRGTVCTPERGYIEDGGFNQFIADVKELARQHLALRANSGMHTQCGVLADRVEQLEEAIRDADALYMGYDGSPSESAAEAFQFLFRVLNGGSNGQQAAGPFTNEEVPAERQAESELQPESQASATASPAAAKQMRKALETVLTWLTNANAMPTSVMVASVFRALGAAGMSKEDLDKAAICVLRGAAPQKQLDDDGVREMLAHHGINYC